MRIGILTFSCADNVGAVLQCFALKSYLDKCGHDTEIINYRPYYLTDAYGLFHNPFEYIKRHGLYHTLTRMRYELCNYRVNKPKTAAFNQFREEYLGIFSAGGRTSHELAADSSKYDAVIVGSDQIWGKASDRNSVDTVFLLDFVDKGTLKISYAASMGNLHSGDTEMFAQYLKTFNSISAREKDLSEYLETVLNRKVPQVLDPVFLNDCICYDNICSNRIDTKSDYIFVYVLEQNTLISTLVSKLTEINRNIKVVYYSREKITFNCKAERVDFLDPETFLNLVRNADKVITNSFHGTAFSILYKKDFYCVPHTQSGSRMVSLLENLGLSNRLVNRAIEISAEIDWKTVYEELNREIEDSKEFLRSALYKEKLEVSAGGET